MSCPVSGASASSNAACPVSGAKSTTTPTPVARKAVLPEKIFEGVVYSVLTGTLAAVSQLSLSPVYGSIPSSLWHSTLVSTACFLGWAGSSSIVGWIKLPPSQLIPLLALYFPVTQYYMFPTSTYLESVLGSVATEAVTLFPIIVLAVAHIASLIEDYSLPGLPSWISDSVPGLALYSLFRVSESTAIKALPSYTASTFVQSRIGFQTILAFLYAIPAPSRLLTLGLPALLHTLFFNTHAMTPHGTARLESELVAAEWKLLERTESITGYVSVLQSVAQFGDSPPLRVMRCDHSLLGGNWILPDSPALVAEPIFSVFTLLEAVRLVDMDPPIVDSNAKALVVGLGVGTLPGALVAHGIDTTVIEIDPAVVDFAHRYFNMPDNYTIIVDDAVTQTKKLVEEQKQYDYVIHDVFTGGAEPVPLFTVEFFRGLYDLMKPNGVVAINYAGDFLLPPPQIILQTIHTVFPTCRIFREGKLDQANVESHGADFINLVIFCRKDNEPISFRPVVRNDLLRSLMRERSLPPEHEVYTSEFAIDETAVRPIYNNDSSELSYWHETTAVKHWKIMRKVLPDNVWLLW